MGRGAPYLASRAFGRAVFWEFVQNLPLIAGFFVALALWRGGGRGPAVAITIAASVAGALTIWATEGKIVPGHREPIGVVATNIVALAVLMLVFTAYLSARWSSTWTDAVVGLVGGVGLGVAQSVAARTRIGWVHCLALGVSFALGLAGVRAIVAAMPLWAGILVVTVAVTAVIAVIDYGRPAQER